MRPWLPDWVILWVLDVGQGCELHCFLKTNPQCYPAAFRSFGVVLICLPRKTQQASDIHMLLLRMGCITGMYEWSHCCSSSVPGPLIFAKDIVVFFSDDNYCSSPASSQWVKISRNVLIFRITEKIISGQGWLLAFPGIERFLAITPVSNCLALANHHHSSDCLDYCYFRHKTVFLNVQTTSQQKSIEAHSTVMQPRYHFKLAQAVSSVLHATIYLRHVPHL